MRKKLRRKDLKGKIQYLTCPKDWRASYREYMRNHDVPFVERYEDGILHFILSRKYRPHQWKLRSPE